MRILKYRLATMEDADRLLQWRNDPLTRRMSRNQKKIKRDNHIKYLKRVLNNGETKLYIAEENTNPVGMVRVDKDNMLSWVVAPNNRGRGIGTQMVSEIADNIEDPIGAEVKHNNPNSISIALKAGMVNIKVSDDMLYFYRESKKLCSKEPSS